MNSKERNQICPGCRRHCDLNEPNCERGSVFAETGVLPEGAPGINGPRGGMRGPMHGPRGGHGPHGKKGGPHRRTENRPFEDREIAGDINARLAHHLHTVGHMMRMRFDDREGQTRILVMLHDGPISQRDLTERLGIQPGSASEVLNKLESAGRIVRTPNGEDRRTMNVALTEAGREDAAKAVEERRSRRGKMFACLTEAEKETLVSLIEKLKSSWREGSGETQDKSAAETAES